MNALSTALNTVLIYHIIDQPEGRELVSRTSPVSCWGDPIFFLCPLTSNAGKQQKTTPSATPIEKMSEAVGSPFLVIFRIFSKKP